MTVEVCPDCDIAGCAHIRNRTGAFVNLYAIDTIKALRDAFGAIEIAEQYAARYSHLKAAQEDVAAAWEQADTLRKTAIAQADAFLRKVGVGE